LQELSCVIPLEKMPGDLFIQNRLAQRKRSLASMHAKLERCKKSLALLATSLLPLAEVECVPWTGDEVEIRTIDVEVVQGAFGDSPRVPFDRLRCRTVACQDPKRNTDSSQARDNDRKKQVPDRKSEFNVVSWHPPLVKANRLLTTGWVELFGSPKI
jgi:hypothetical protein